MIKSTLFVYIFLLSNPSINKNEVIVKTIIDLGLNASTVLYIPVLPSQSTGQIFSNADRIFAPAPVPPAHWSTLCFSKVRCASSSSSRGRQILRPFGIESIQL